MTGQEIPEPSACDREEICQYDPKCLFFAENCRHDYNFRMDNFDPDAQAQVQAMAELQHAEAQAAALLAELQAKDAANAAAATVHKMPAPYAPGDEPDPVKGVAPSAHEQVLSALESSFKPVDLSRVKETTLASSHTVDFAQKIRDAQKFGGSH